MLGLAQLLLHNALLTIYRLLFRFYFDRVLLELSLLELLFLNLGAERDDFICRLGDILFLFLDGLAAARHLLLKFLLETAH